MKITLELDKDGADQLLGALNYAISQANSLKVKKQLTKISKEIQSDYWFDNNIFTFVHQLLDPYTRARIYKNSNLRNQLGIEGNWLNNYLHVGCNKIVFHMLAIRNINGKPDLISSAKAKKCQTVQQVINLIKDSYESAV